MGVVAFALLWYLNEKMKEVTWILIILSVLNIGIFTVISDEICIKETFTAECSHDHIILMKSAFYGLMNNGRCWPEQHSSTGCYDNVIRYFDARCSGKRQCSSIVGRDDELLDLAISCPSHLSPYLEASYNCVEGRF